MSSSAAVMSAHDPALDLLPSELQDTIMEQKFAQIREQRREAHHVLREAKQRTRNQQTDQQILMLMQTDERLASLLSQAADSMRALLPVKPPSPDTVRLAPSDATSASASASSSSASEPSHGAKAFESKAQQWFSILNEVQYSLRSAVRYLRESNLAPLTPPAGAEARLSGNAGSAARAHSLSLLDAFVDLAGIDGPTFKLPPAAPAPASSATASLLPDPVLSVHALRERDRNWKALSSSLQHMHNDSKLAAQSTAHTAPRTSPSIELSLLESIRNGCSSDRILIDALVNTNSMA